MTASTSSTPSTSTKIPSSSKSSVTKQTKQKRNERERKRVDQVNQGFVLLQERVPKAAGNKAKLSKVRVVLWCLGENVKQIVNLICLKEKFAV